MFMIPILYGLMGLLLIGLSIPLILGKVPPNVWYGFRIRLTLDNPDTWYAVNTWAGRRLFAIGLATLVAALVSLLIPGPFLRWYSLILAALLVVGIGLLLVLGIRYARDLAGR